jgi:hypothetical protein
VTKKRGEARKDEVMQVRSRWNWLLGAALLAAAACGDDDDDDDDSIGEMDSVLDVLVDAAEGVLAGVQSVRASYLVAGSTSCDGLTSRRVTPSQFTNRRDPVLALWDGLGNPHVTTEIANGPSQVLIEAYTNEEGSGEPSAAGCEDAVYVAPGDTFHTTIQVRLNP